MARRPPEARSDSGQALFAPLGYHPSGQGEKQIHGFLDRKGNFAFSLGERPCLVLTNVMMIGLSFDVVNRRAEGAHTGV